VFSTKEIVVKNLHFISPRQGLGELDEYRGKASVRIRYRQEKQKCAVEKKIRWLAHHFRRAAKRRGSRPVGCFIRRHKMFGWRDNRCCAIINVWNLFTLRKPTGRGKFFDSSKLEFSLKNAGAGSATIETILDDISDLMVDGMTTHEIYNRAFEIAAPGGTSGRAVLLSETSNHGTRSVRFSF